MFDATRRYDTELNYGKEEIKTGKERKIAEEILRNEEFSSGFRLFSADAPLEDFKIADEEENSMPLIDFLEEFVRRLKEK